MPRGGARLKTRSEVKKDLVGFWHGLQGALNTTAVLLEGSLQVKTGLPDIASVSACLERNCPDNQRQPWVLSSLESITHYMVPKNLDYLSVCGFDAVTA